MARLNAITQPRWNSPLIRFFGLKVSGAAADTLSPEIAPSFDINQQDDAQLAYLRGEKLGAFGFVLTSAAGFYSTAALRNPANSGVLVTVKGIQFFSQGSQINLSLSTIADLTSSGYCTPLDTRWGPLATVKTSSRYTYRNDSAGPLTGQRIAQYRSNVQHYVDTPILLVPDTALIIETSVVNADLTWGIWFSERAIPAEELSTG